MRWLAAGALIIREAGGIVSALDGSENYLDTGHILCGTPRIYSGLAKLFAPDIRVSRDKTGRAHLKRWLDDTLRLQFTGTSHHIGNHIIEFDDADHAHGVVYSKNEHETPCENGNSEWVIMQMLYWDNYQRIDGRWYFRRRLPCYWYATDLNKPPVGDDKMRWPDRENYAGAFHELWPSWAEFWASGYSADSDVPAPAPLDDFLAAVRTQGDEYSVRVR